MYCNSVESLHINGKMFCFVLCSALQGECVTVSFFCKGWRHLLCFVYNFSRLDMFCTIISSGHKQGKGVKDTGEWCNSTIVWVKMFYLLRGV